MWTSRRLTASWAPASTGLLLAAAYCCLCCIICLPADRHLDRSCTSLHAFAGASRAEGRPACRTYCALAPYSSALLYALVQNQSSNAQFSPCTDDTLAYTAANLTSGQYLFAVVAYDNAKNHGRSSVYNVQVSADSLCLQANWGLQCAETCYSAGVCFCGAEVQPVRVACARGPVLTPVALRRSSL